ncbi:MAG TPA: glycoside hydrolase family 172 protein [Acidobacteriaceae bacterium]|nr:glycoside hydrolase family 172 protein [Acidobacteriaceae bacterium]
MKITVYVLLASVLMLSVAGEAQNTAYSGLGNSLANIFQLSNVHTFSISPENPTGAKGAGGMATEGTGTYAARDLGRGWKVSPSVVVQPGQAYTLGQIDGSGEIQHIWMTVTGNWRMSILRMYWDGESEPSVEVPVGDFFAMGWGQYAQLSSLAVCVNPGSGFNSYWPMPFRTQAKLTLENLDDKPITVYYQIDYTNGPVPANVGYFHAQFRRVNPVPYKHVYTILDGVTGKGQYVGTYLAFGVHSDGWWGEGEIKFYIDGDKEFPTVNGTGTEDYFGGSYDFEDPATHQYQVFTTPYSGLAQVIKPNGLYQAEEKFGLYRWHIADPIRFDHNLRVTIQDLGWQSGGRYRPRQDDIASVAYWYQTLPHAPFPKLPGKDQLAVN